MRRTKKKTSRVKISEIQKIAQTYAPSVILGALAKEYAKYPSRSKTDAEHEFWIKVSRSTANLASGMDKWVTEWIDEEEEEKE